MLRMYMHQLLLCGRCSKAQHWHCCRAPKRIEAWIKAVFIDKKFYGAPETEVDDAYEVCSVETWAAAAMVRIAG